MKSLEKVGAAVVLAFVLVLPAFADQTDTPTCTAPGQIETPPCAAASGNMSTSKVTSTTFGTMRTPVSDEAPYTNLAVDVLLNLLPLF